MSKLKFGAVLTFMLVIAAAGNCSAGWSPVKFQVSKNGLVWPSDIDLVTGLDFSFVGETSDVYGAQIGFQNGTSDLAGVQLGLIFNYALNGFYGIQASPARNFADIQYGLQLGGWSESTYLWGIQAGWLKNWTQEGHGLMMGTVNVSETRMKGIQLGVVNNAQGDMSGIQIGLANICRGTLKGVQIGFANLGGRNALLPVTIGLNAGF